MIKSEASLHLLLKNLKLHEMGRKKSIEENFKNNPGQIGYWGGKKAQEELS